MVRLEYSQIVRKKLINLKNELLKSYGEKETGKIIKKITKGVRQLEIFPQSGISVSSNYDIDCDYHYIFVERNYFFYRINYKKKVIIFYIQILEIFSSLQITLFAFFLKKLLGMRIFLHFSTFRD